MKAKVVIIATVAGLLSSSCLFYMFTHDMNEYTVRGYLYSDSTKEVPLANAELAFYRSSELIGTAETDSNGFWGLWYKYNPESSHDLYPNNAKFQLAEWEMVITYDNDTLYCCYGHCFPLNDTLVLYPGIDWQHYEY